MQKLGNLVFETFKTGEMQDSRTFKYLLAAATGIGKSYTALSMTKDILVFDADKRLSHLNKQFSFHRIAIDSIYKIKELLQENSIIWLKRLISEHKIKLICIDSITSLYEMLQVSKQGNKDMLNMNDWGVVKSALNNFIRIVESLGLPILFLAQARWDKDQWVIDAEKRIPDSCDCIIHLLMDNSGNRSFKILKDTVRFRRQNSELKYDDLKNTYFHNLTGTKGDLSGTDSLPTSPQSKNNIMENEKADIIAKIKKGLQSLDIEIKRDDLIYSALNHVGFTDYLRLSNVKSGVFNFTYQGLLNLYNHLKDYYSYSLKVKKEYEEKNPSSAEKKEEIKEEKKEGGEEKKKEETSSITNTNSDSTLENNSKEPVSATAGSNLFNIYGQRSKVDKSIVVIWDKIGFFMENKCDLKYQRYSFEKNIDALLNKGYLVGRPESLEDLKISLSILEERFNNKKTA